jgi:hypothetical protein
MNRRRFLSFLGAAFGLAAVGLRLDGGGDVAPVVFRTGWLKLASKRYGVGRYVVTFPEAVTVTALRLTISAGDWTFSAGDTDDRAVP